jgi:PhnB protein
MHATLNIGGSSLMVSDGNSTEPSGFKGFRLSLGVDTTEEAERIFNALLPGGNVIVPLGKTF